MTHLRDAAEAWGISLPRSQLGDSGHHRFDKPKHPGPPGTEPAYCCALPLSRWVPADAPSRRLLLLNDAISLPEKRPAPAPLAVISRCVAGAGSDAPTRTLGGMEGVPSVPFAVREHPRDRDGAVAAPGSRPRWHHSRRYRACDGATERACPRPRWRHCCQRISGLRHEAVERQGDAAGLPASWS